MADCFLVARLARLARFFGDFFADFFLVERFFVDFFEPFFLVDRLADFFAAFFFFAMSYGSFRFSAHFTSLVYPPGRQVRGETNGLENHPQGMMKLQIGAH
jgi:hypothetical protein